MGADRKGLSHKSTSRSPGAGYLRLRMERETHTNKEKIGICHISAKYLSLFRLFTFVSLSVFRPPRRALTHLFCPAWFFYSTKTSPSGQTLIKTGISNRKPCVTANSLNTIANLRRSWHTISRVSSLSFSISISDY